ncbi:MAG TPA: SPFH domain-containing protein, partial [Vicinamibacterales bacterium]
MVAFSLQLLLYVSLLVVLLAALVIAAKSVHRIGPNEVGLVIRRWGRTNRSEGPIALNGEAGYQADLLMPGIAFRAWPLNRVEKHPWVQVPTGEIGLVVSQVGAALPTGWKSGVYKPEFGQFTNVRGFITHGGQQGVQRPVLPPGTIVPLHPVAFLVLTRSRSFGMPVNEEYRGKFGPALFGLEPDDLRLKVIEPIRIREKESGAERTIDMVGIVETREGEPLASGDIACRLGRFDDVKAMEAAARSDGEIADVLIGNQNDRHNNYQDYQKFLDAGGKIGLQHDPLLYGSYALNPYLVRVETVPMLVVRQGEVAVIKAAVGLPTEDTSGDEFKFGSIVRPGHRGIWEEPLRTGKYAINPRIYQAEMVPTAILTLNWADASSQAHNLDKQLKQIVAKSKEGFVFNIDLQVQIHVADKLAPKVISMVGTMQNLVNEVLQAVVGNYFRDT